MYLTNNATEEKYNPMIIMPETELEIQLDVLFEDPQTESSSELEQRHRSDEDEEQPQRHQQRRLFTLIFAGFFLCIIMIGLIYGVQHLQTTRKRHAGPVRPCESDACRQAAAHLSVFADPLTRPCDFYLFTCGSDLKRDTEHPGFPQGQRPVPKQMGRQLSKEKRTDRKTLLLQYLRDTLDSHESPMSSAEQKVQTFYHSCLDNKSIETAGAEPFLTLIQKLGGWAVSGHWNQTDFNSTLGQLMRNYGTFPFFNLLVGKHPNETTSRKYIQIDQPDLWIPFEWNSHYEKSDVKAEILRPFFSMCERYLALLGAPVSSRMTHVGLFISLSSELAVAAAPLEYRLAKGQLYQRITVRELQTAFEAVTLTEDEPVLVHNLPYIIKMSQTIRKWINSPDSSNRGPLHTFMLFNLLHTMMPALDSRFSETVQPRWKSCVLETERGFDYILTHRLSERIPHTEAREIIDNILSSLKTKLHGLHWNNQKSHKAVMKKVHSFTPKLWTSNQTIKELDRFFTEIAMGSNFFWNYAQLLSLWQKRRIKLLNEQTESIDILSVRPVLNGNELVFPLGIFVPPLFHPTYPRAINYGVIGFLIAKDILHLLLPDMHGQCDSVHTVADCVWKHYLGASDWSGAGGRSLSIAQQQEVWVQYSALDIALQAYHKSLKSRPSDTSLSGFSHTDLFLKAFSQMNCDSDPQEEAMPLAPSFLVKVLCSKSEKCHLHCTSDKHVSATC